MNDGTPSRQPSSHIGRSRLWLTCIVTVLGGVGTFEGFQSFGHPFESLPILAIYCLVLGWLLTKSSLAIAHGVQLGLGLALTCVSFITLQLIALAAALVVTNFVSMLAKLLMAGVFNVPMVFSGVAGRVTFAKGWQEKVEFYLSLFIASVIAAGYTYLSYWRPWEAAD